MKKEVFRGIGTAMITPMTEKGVDYAAMERLIERQIEAGIDALHSGEYVDGKEFSSLLERTQESGVQVEELMGD
ncbi:MAG: dihydrodipicolinate synthase family protein, partial [Oscillospiraceae bacterium]|nr:dihydrodipicolinate synthase family protein [Oscillospiraceae bacterium]